MLLQGFKGSDRSMWSFVRIGAIMVNGAKKVRLKCSLVFADVMPEAEKCSPTGWCEAACKLFCEGGCLLQVLLERLP
jgi:hypothetical protein